VDEGLSTYQWNRDRVARLERANARVSSYTQPNYQWNFRVAVSCPPSTVIHMRGGQVWGDPKDWSGKSWYVESASYDLADEGETGYHYIFTNAHWYKPLAVMLRYSGNPTALGTNPPLRIVTSGEWATAAEAEEAAYPTIATGRFDPYAWYGIPLGVFILRNSGNTTAYNQFMPIDRVNRGGSYLFRELKLRFQW